MGVDAFNGSKLPFMLQSQGKGMIYVRKGMHEDHFESKGSKVII